MKIKKLGLLRLLGLLLISFGITQLDFNNPALSLNYKAYSALVVGAIFVIASFISKQKAM